MAAVLAPQRSRRSSAHYAPEVSARSLNVALEGWKSWPVTGPGPSWTRQDEWSWPVTRLSGICFWSSEWPGSTQRNCCARVRPPAPPHPLPPPPFFPYPNSQGSLARGSPPWRAAEAHIHLTQSHASYHRLTCPIVHRWSWIRAVYHRSRHDGTCNPCDGGLKKMSRRHWYRDIATQANPSLIDRLQNQIRVFWSFEGVYPPPPTHPNQGKIRFCTPCRRV